jgi:lysophospholipase L1-like esterase
MRTAAAAALAAAALVLVAGCGGGTDGSNGNGNLVVALGDSIAAGSIGYEQDPTIRKILNLGNNPRSQWEYWAQKKYPKLNFRNCGVPGERTDEILQRFDVCATGADALVVNGGLNDLTQGVPVRAVAANLRGMVRDAKAESIAVAIADVIPVNQTHPDLDPLIAELNRGIERIGRSEHVPVLHFHDTLENPSEPGTMKPEFVASDNIHPSVAGYRRLGEVAFKPPEN